MLNVHRQGGVGGILDDSNTKSCTQVYIYGGTARAPVLRFSQASTALDAGARAEE